ncbi:MAG: hypothetical protein GX879_01030 [Bacteroidales bacterium]|nr:hypothetical protein [Bacteroidales bacterium]
MRKKLLILFFVSLGLTSLAFSQTMLHPKFSFVGIHGFSEPNRHLFENKIDAEAWFVTEPALMFSIETLIYDEILSLSFMPGFYNDAVSKPALFFAVSLKMRLFQSWRNSMYVSAGGSILGRERWETIHGYVYERGFKANGSWEYNVGPFAELEYVLMLNERNDLSFSTIFGHQQRTFTFSVGYRFWLSTIIKHPKKCGNCPFIKIDNKHKKY